MTYARSCVYAGRRRRMNRILAVAVDAYKFIVTIRCGISSRLRVPERAHWLSPFHE
jgi:hypothetical protein